MPGPLRTTRFALIAVPLSVALLIGAGGCGGGADGGESEEPATAAAKVADFPAADGRTLGEIAADASPTDLVVVPASQVFNTGKNRIGLGVFTVDHENVPDVQMAIYAAPGKAGKAVGPFPAKSESLQTPAAFRAESTSQDPDAATYVYTADAKFDRDGDWFLLALIREADGSFTYANIPTAAVGKFDDVPQPGDKAPVVSTPTADSVGGDLTKIDTRQPPSSMHTDDLADVIGKQPVVLLFATPALCTSRVCGPVVDIAEQVKSERGEDAAFIHMEIYENNDPNKGLRKQVSDYNLPTEPWLFVIDADGKISTAIEGAFSKRELDEALDRVS